MSSVLQTLAALLSCKFDMVQVICSLVAWMFAKPLQLCIFRLHLNLDLGCHDSGVCLTGSGSLPPSASGQNIDGHVTSLQQQPMSGPLTGSNDAQYNMGPSNSSQHHSGPQAWGMNEAV